MTLEYKKVPLRSKEDFDNAEALQVEGWKPIVNGLDYTLLERIKENV